MTKDDIARVGCIACLIDGNPGTPAELHHCRIAGGKRELAFIIGLCPPHHRGGVKGVVSIHKSKTAFRARYGTEEELYRMVEGRVAVIKANTIGGR